MKDINRRFSLEGTNIFFRNKIEEFLKEDGFSDNDYYFASLPQNQVTCELKFKSDLMVAGLPYFFSIFDYLVAGRELSNQKWERFFSWEGRKVRGDERSSISFSLPFGVALTGERLALNLLQRASAVATFTHLFVEKSKKYGIAILDTRKTTPGLRFLEKYAVRVGGGYNHRFSQVDMWMIKDNHKKFFGGIRPAIEYFKSLQAFYVPLLVEIHSLSELEEAISLKINHVMLDNFSPEEIKEAVKIKNSTMTYEVSGGIRLDNIESYLMHGVDALSIGGLTNNPPSVDISLKYFPE